MEYEKKAPKAAGPRRDHLSPEVQRVLHQIETEDVPERLLRLAMQLQDALDERLRTNRH